MLIEDLDTNLWHIMSFFNHMEKTFPWNGERSNNSAHSLRSAGNRKANSCLFCTEVSSVFQRA